tara:strand:+ start:790 stop:1215 length:426 start_codon:yes stop_codon:yes gene_type:complete
MKKDPFDKIDKFGMQLLFAFCFGVFIILAARVMAEPTWVHKPIQCDTIEEVTKHYELGTKLKPLFVGVAVVRSQQGRVPMPVAFFLDQDSGNWLFLEFGFDGQQEGCVVSLGDGWDPNVDEYDIVPNGELSDKTEYYKQES